MDEYLCRTAFLYCGGRNGTFDPKIRNYHPIHD